ncbi:MAG: WD40 repeat domain-containing protein [Anaerolineales bacterium]|nr:WD40 repeat domain-containing protein [Anaerolineales bacterium]
MTVVAIGLLGACARAVEAVSGTESERAFPSTSPAASSPESISSSTGEQVELLHTLEGHSGRVMHVAFSADSARLASSSEDMTIRVWDAGSGQETCSIPMTRRDMADIAFSPEGNLLASGEAIWDVENWQELYVLERDRQVPAKVAFSPDGSTLAVAVMNCPIQLWDTATGEIIRTFDMQAEPLTFNIQFSPDGELLAAGELGGRINLWDVASGQLAAMLEYGDESGVHAVAFSPDGHMLASGGTMPSIRLWDVFTGEVLDSLMLPDGLFGLAFFSGWHDSGLCGRR